MPEHAPSTAADLTRHTGMFRSDFSTKKSSENCPSLGYKFLNTEHRRSRQTFVKSLREMHFGRDGGHNWILRNLAIRNFNTNSHVSGELAGFRDHRAPDAIASRFRLEDPKKNSGAGNRMQAPCSRIIILSFLLCQRCIPLRGHQALHH